ncbi:MAG TPA: hypothetical protein VHE12_11200, partial [bacterium]|nr:hypothetical protein [bacterium]
MKNNWKAFGLALALLGMAGCQQANGPTGSTPTGPGTMAKTMGSPDVNCHQSCSPGSAPVGASVTFTVQVDVTGGAATGAQVLDILPAGLTYVQGSASSLAGGTFVCTGQTLSWIAATVGPCNCAMSYVAKVNELAGVAGSTLANTAIMTCAELSAAVSTTANLVVSAVPTLPPTPTVGIPTFTCTPVPPTPTFTCAPPTPTPTF